MTVRELVRDLLDLEKDLDREIKIRLIRRDEAGVVQEEKLLPLARLHSGNLVLEQAEVTGTVWART